MRMIDLGGQRGGPIYIIDTPTDIDCTREVRLRRSFRSLVEFMVPCCGFQHTSDHNTPSSHPSTNSSPHAYHHQPTTTTTTNTTTSTVTGTFFGHRKGRVSFCLQDHTRSSPLLLLEFAVPTAYLAREMQHGLLRIALECKRVAGGGGGSPRPASLFATPAWTMYCNGRKVGFAVKRAATGSDAAVLKMMQSVSVGAGVVPAAEEEGEIMYLRASFERVVGSADSESFHMINPVGSSGQELSIFLLRS